MNSPISMNLHSLHQIPKNEPRKKKKKMEKLAIVLVSAVCIMSLVNIASCQMDKFLVEGKVYCDTCRVQFFTKASTYMEGATVILECKAIEGGAVTLSKEAVTDKTGTYKIEVDGDHEEEVCEVALVKTIDPDCNEIWDQGFDHKSRVSITANSGIPDSVRLANPLAFMKREKLHECKEILRELGFDEFGNMV